MTARLFRVPFTLCARTFCYLPKRCASQCGRPGKLWDCRPKHNNNNNRHLGFLVLRKYSQGSSSDSGSKSRLIWLVYFSAFLGGVMLIAILRREFQKYQRRKRGLEEMKISSFGNRLFICKYKGCVLFDNVGTNIEDIEKFSVREDDVWLVGWPRSGTTWSQEIIYLIMTGLDFRAAKEATLDDRFPYLEFVYPGLDAISNYPSPRLIRSHLPLHLLPDEVHLKKPKIIYVARNPKDVVVSYYHFIRMLLPFRFSGQFPEFFTLFMNDQLPYSPWWRHVRQFWEHRNDNNILFIKYEDLQKDLEGCVRRISAFLDKPLSDKQVAQIVDHCSFIRMKGNEAVNYTWFDKFGLRRKGEADFIRKGKIGDWRNYMTAEMSGRIDKLVEEKLVDVGLDFQFDSQKTE